MDTTTAHSSFDNRSSLRPHPSRLSNLKQGSLDARSLTASRGPHDQNLEELYNLPGKSDIALPIALSVDGDRFEGGTRRLMVTEASADQNTKSRSSGNDPANPDGAFSTTSSPSLTSNPFPSANLYDPFDGSLLGVILPAETHHGAMPANIDGISNEELWSNLSRILDLQNEIARMHVDMEGVGAGKQDGKGKGVLRGTSRPMGFRPRTASTGSVPGVDIEDEGGVGVMGEEEEKLKTREREFKKLATQFEGRKKSINEMMSKLDDLSKALTEFNSLQEPTIEFPNSKNNSLDHLPPTELDDPGARMPLSSPPTFLQFSQLGKGSDAPLNPKSCRPDLKVPLSHKAHVQVPPVIIDSGESESQPHVVESPLSTPSLEMPSDNILT